MECNTYREQMSLWIDDQLNQDQIQRIEAHVAVCPACRATLDAFQQVDRLFSSIPMMSPVPGFSARFQVRLAARRRRRRTWAGLATLIVATLALLGGTSILIALSGLALWGSLTTSGMLTQMISLLLDLGKAVAASLSLVWLILRALAQGLRHPVFIAYVVATAVLLVVWSQIAMHRTLAYRLIRVGDSGF